MVAKMDLLIYSNHGSTIAFYRLVNGWWLGSFHLKNSIVEPDSTWEANKCLALWASVNFTTMNQQKCAETIDGKADRPKKCVLIIILEFEKVLNKEECLH